MVSRLMTLATTDSTSADPASLPIQAVKSSHALPIPTAGFAAVCRSALRFPPRCFTMSRLPAPMERFVCEAAHCRAPGAGEKSQTAAAVIRSSCNGGMPESGTSNHPSRGAACTCEKLYICLQGLESKHIAARCAGWRVNELMTDTQPSAAVAYTLNRGIKWEVVPRRRHLLSDQLVPSPFRLIWIRRWLVGSMISIRSIGLVRCPCRCPKFAP